MLFAVDVGNSSVSFGVFNADGALVMRSKVDAVRSRSADEYAVLFKEILRLHHVESDTVRGAILSSVVPPLTHAVKCAIQILFGVLPLEVGAGVRTGLNIKVDMQAQLGADLVANAVAVLSEQSAPFVIVDFGTATTFTVVDAGGVLCGVIIAPGVRVSLDALAEYGSELPDVSVEPPRRLIGKNTQDSVRSGVLYGHAAMVDGLLARISEELGLPTPCVIATGGLAEAVLPYCRIKARLCPDLTLTGLYHIWEKNRK